MCGNCCCPLALKPLHPKPGISTGASPCGTAEAIPSQSRQEQTERWRRDGSKDQFAFYIALSSCKSSQLFSHTSMSHLPAAGLIQQLPLCLSLLCTWSMGGAYLTHPDPINAAEPWVKQRFSLPSGCLLPLTCGPVTSLIPRDCRCSWCIWTVQELSKQISPFHDAFPQPQQSPPLWSHNETGLPQDLLC